MENRDKKDLLKEVGKFFEGAFRAPGKALEGIVKTLQGAAKQIKAAADNIGRTADKLWNAYGRFADFMKAVENNNWKDRAEAILKAAETDEKRFNRILTEIEGLRLVQRANEMLRTAEEVKTKYETLKTKLDAAEKAVEGITQPIESIRRLIEDLKQKLSQLLALILAVIDKLSKIPSPVEKIKKGLGRFNPFRRP